MTREQFDALDEAEEWPEAAAAGYPFMPEDDAALSRIASELAWRGLVPIARGEAEGLAVIYGGYA